MPVRTRREKQLIYACFVALREELEKLSVHVAAQQSAGLYAAHQAYMETPEIKAVKLDNAAKAAARVVTRLEPRLRKTIQDQALHLFVQDEPGDERDIVCMNRQNGWEVGLSCRLSHERQRLQFTCFTDFGQEWFTRPCSPPYFEEIRPIYDEMWILEERSEEWKDVPGRNERFFYPFQNALLSELKRMDEAHPGEIPAKMLLLLVGRKDFYRVIPEETSKQTRIEACNPFGTLGLSAKRGEAPRVTRMNLPHAFFQASKRITNDLFVLATDEGWAYSFRVGGCGKKVDPKLCVDLELVGVPRNIYTQIEPW